MKGDETGVDSDGDGGKMKVVEEHRQMIVKPLGGREVQLQCPTKQKANEARQTFKVEAWKRARPRLSIPPSPQPHLLGLWGSSAFSSRASARDHNGRKEFTEVAEVGVPSTISAFRLLSFFFLFHFFPPRATLAIPRNAIFNDYEFPSSKLANFQPWIKPWIVYGDLRSESKRPTLLNFIYPV